MSARAASGEPTQARALLYGLPMLGAGALGGLLSLYFFRYATSALGVAPALLGALYAAARVWEGVADVGVGGASDRTRLRLGRRRPWLLAAAPLLALAFVALWSPPGALSGGALAAWLAGGLLLFYLGDAAFGVPHFALAAELAESERGRARLFAARTVFEFAGVLVAIAGVHALESSAAPRTLAGRAAPLAALGVVLLVAPCALAVHEPTRHRRVAPRRALASFGAVRRNRDARPLFAVFGLQQLCLATVLILLPFATEHLLGRPGATAHYLLAALLPLLASVPLWLWLARRFDRLRLWAAATAGTALGFGGLLFAGPGSAGFALGLCVAIGTGLGGGELLAATLQADVIDADELRTGERREGAYAAAWSLARKAAAALAAGAAGLLLQAAGLGAPGEPGAGALLLLRLGVAALPALLFVLATAVLLRWRFDARARAALRVALEAQRAAAAQPSEGGPLSSTTLPSGSRTYREGPMPSAP